MRQSERGIDILPILSKLTECVLEEVDAQPQFTPPNEFRTLEWRAPKFVSWGPVFTVVACQWVVTSQRNSGVAMSRRSLRVTAVASLP